MSVRVLVLYSVVNLITLGQKLYASLGLPVTRQFILGATQASNVIIPLIILSGCATPPAEVREVKVPVPVMVSCPTVDRPEMVKPRDDSRVEWLRAELINHERLKAYAKELESTLSACQ